MLGLWSSMVETRGEYIGQWCWMV